MAATNMKDDKKTEKAERKPKETPPEPQPTWKKPMVIGIVILSVLLVGLTAAAIAIGTGNDETTAAPKTMFMANDGDGTSSGFDSIPDGTVWLVVLASLTVALTESMYMRY
jgi:hypothetical protein